VELQATISKQGTIEDLRVVSGPAMLQQAALDAVRQWRYRPYLLNNEPVEVETKVDVIFTLGG
jgi:protein TonB